MKTAHDLINESGYPLQLYVAEEINNFSSEHGWRVLVKEHRWVNSETQDEGYIDIILEHKSYFIRFVVECKRISGSWNFLLPENNPILVKRSKLLIAEYPSPVGFRWEDRGIYPESCEATFCVMEVEGKKDSRTLEKISGELLLSLESLAAEEVQLLSATSRSQHNKLYIPIIVTTANLQACLFDPKDISAEDGNIKTAGEIHKVEFIRFRKNLAGNPIYQNQEFNDLKESNLENERTIIVVQAKSITNFLQNFRIL